MPSNQRARDAYQKMCDHLANSKIKVEKDDVFWELLMEVGTAIHWESLQEEVKEEAINA
jgi:hypothetical protein